MTSDIDPVIRILTVNISSEKGTAKSPVPFIDLDADGVVGDAHRGTPGRQVSLLDRTLVEGTIGSKETITIPEGAMGENITFVSTTPLDFRIGDIIAFRDAVLRVERIGKECHGSGCAIFRSLGGCVMPANGIFCSVETMGRLMPGDTGIVRRSPSVSP